MRELNILEWRGVNLTAIAKVLSIVLRSIEL